MSVDNISLKNENNSENVSLKNENNSENVSLKNENNDEKLDRNELLRSLLQHKHPTPKLISLEDKVLLIKRILEITAFDPEQGSKEWAEGRQIGGSDAAAMLGKGYYGKSEFDVVSDKIFPGRFMGNTATRFGKIFEEVDRLIVEQIFGHKVWEFKSLPNQLPFTTYSPDGVTIAYLFHRLIMILLEFKTPLSRIPDGKIPKEYMPQIKSGMCALPFVDGALFVNTMLRICGLKDFGYNFEYNVRFHKSDTTTCKTRPIKHKDKLTDVVALGMAVLYQTDVNRSNVKEHFDVGGDDEEFGNAKYVSSRDHTFVVFDTGPSFEDDLLKTKELIGDKAVSAIYARHRNRIQYYSKVSDQYPNLDIPNFESENKDTLINVPTFDLFKSSLLNESECDFGVETESDTARMLEYIEERKFIQIQHIPPFVVGEKMFQSPLLKACGLTNDNSVNKFNPDYVTEETRIYFIERLNEIRTSWDNLGIHIVGVIPYKVFKMDFVFTPNDDPTFINHMKSGAERYGKIKSECKEIDRSSNDINEKNKAKWEILYKYYPDKKQAQETHEQKSLEDGLISIVADDNFMF